MGGILSRLFNTKPLRLLLLGLDASGKTSLLYFLKMGEVQVTLPTIGFNVETVKQDNVEFTIWDLGGQDRIRRLWRHYYEGMQGLIYVIDSADKIRLNEAIEELCRVLDDDALDRIPVLIYANKQDLPEAATVIHIRECFNLKKNKKARSVHVQGTVFTQNKGIMEGLDWLAKEIKKNKYQ